MKNYFQESKRTSSFVWSRGELFLHICATENPTFGLRLRRKHKNVTHSLSLTTSKSPSMTPGCSCCDTKGTIQIVIIQRLQPCHFGKLLAKEFLFQQGIYSLNENRARICIVSIQITNMQELLLYSTNQDICNILNTESQNTKLDGTSRII